MNSRVETLTYKCVCVCQVPTFERIISASSTPTPPTQFISNRRCNRLPRIKQISFQHDPFRQHYAFTEILALDASALAPVPSRQRTERRGERVLFPCLPCVQTGEPPRTPVGKCKGTRKMKKTEFAEIWPRRFQPSCREAKDSKLKISCNLWKRICNP